MAELIKQSKGYSLEGNDSDVCVFAGTLINLISLFK